MAHYDGHVEAARDAYVRKLEAENAQLKARLRTVAQLGIAEIGADGPEDSESVVGRLVAKIAQLKAELDHFRGILTWIIEQYESADHLGDIDMDEARSILSDAKLKEGA